VVAMAVQVTVERRPDLALGGQLRLIALLTLAAGLVTERPAIQSIVVLVLLAIIVAAATLISVEFM
jgi:hypothetical protein